MKITKQGIASIKLPAGKTDHIEWDDDLPGFGLRLRAGGKRSFIVQYRVGHKQRRETVGDARKVDPDVARKEAKRRLAKVELGHDPQAERVEAKARGRISLGSVMRQYLDFKQGELRASSLEATARYLHKQWKPLHELPVHKIERRHVAAQLAEIAKSSTVTALRARAALSGFYTWAMGEGIADSNPVIGTNKPPEPEARDRTLSPGELAEIWAACRDDDYGRIVRLLTLTLQRRTEVGAMSWAEVDLDRATWSIAGQRTKNHLAHKVPLADFTLSIVKSVPRRADREHLFGEGQGAFSGWSKAKAALDRRIFEARKKAAGKKGKAEPMPHWSPHDLRRTGASVMADKLNVLPHVIEAILNHISGHKAGVAGVYNRAEYVAQKAHALGLWADYVRSIVEGGERKVVPLRP
jgi:integrase